MSKGSAQSII